MFVICCRWFVHFLNVFNVFVWFAYDMPLWVCNFLVVVYGVLWFCTIALWCCIVCMKLYVCQMILYELRIIDYDFVRFSYDFVCVSYDFVLFFRMIVYDSYEFVWLSFGFVRFSWLCMIYIILSNDCVCFYYDLCKRFFVYVLVCVWLSDICVWFV